MVQRLGLIYAIQEIGQSFLFNFLCRLANYGHSARIRGATACAKRL